MTRPAPSRARDRNAKKKLFRQGSAKKSKSRCTKHKRPPLFLSCTNHVTRRWCDMLLLAVHPYYVQPGEAQPPEGFVFGERAHESTAVPLVSLYNITSTSSARLLALRRQGEASNASGQVILTVCRCRQQRLSLFYTAGLGKSIQHKMCTLLSSFCRGREQNR